MAAGDEANAAAVANAMANIYRLDHVAAQFNRWGDTIKWFKPRKLPLQGEQLYFYAFTQPLTGVRRTKSAYETEFPEERMLDHKKVYIAWSNLAEFQCSLAFTGLAQRQTESREAAVYRVANELVMGASDDFKESTNRSMHQNANCTMGVVNGTPTNEDGTTYTGGQTDAFLPIDGGSISQFHQGMILDIRNAASTSSFRTAVKVDDVYITSDGPGAATGPGIVVTIDSVRQAAISGDANMDAVADNDELVLSAEAASNLDSFAVWFGTGSVLNLTRATTKKEHWAVPFIADYASGGLPVTFDWEDHGSVMSEELAYAVKRGRVRRRREGIGITDAMLFLTTPRILSEATRQAADAFRFTTTAASTMDAAKRKDILGTVGFNGVVWHDPVLGNIAPQADAVATPNYARLIEPSSWFFVTGHNNNSFRPEWLDRDGKRWHYARGTNNRLVNKLIAGAFVRLGLVCDQPQANYEIRNVNSSLEA